MSRTQSPIKMPSHAVSGPHVELFWDEQAIERPTDEGVETYYDYAYCRAPRATSYAALVSAIIRSQYSSDQEFSAINNGGAQYDEYQATRQTAKTLAREYLGMPPLTLDEKRAQAKMSRAGFKLALLAGGYLTAIEDAYGMWPKDVQIMWDDSSVFERMHPSLLQLAGAMGFSGAEVDALFGIV